MAELFDQNGETREYQNSLRQQYIGLIKGIKPLSGEADSDKRKDLTPTKQSLLYLLRNAETIGIDEKDRMVGRSLEALEKVPLMLRVGEELGFRPETTSFSIDSQNRKLPKHVEDFATAHPVIFIKANKSYRADDVFMVLRRDDGTFLITRAGSNNRLAPSEVDTLSELLLPSNLYIVEAEIDAAPATNERDEDTSWEIRYLPPFPSEYNYAKVSPAITQFVNNISRGGQRRNAKQTVMDVIKRRGTHDPSRVETLANEFISQSQQLSQKVKSLTDGIQIGIAKKIIKPEDLKDSIAYEEIMQGCFSGTFLTVDITGFWDRLDRLGTLQPMIIEAQTSAGLPGEPGFIIMNRRLLTLGTPPNLTYLAYEQCLAELNKKLFEIQRVLK